MKNLKRQDKPAKRYIERDKVMTRDEYNKAVGSWRWILGSYDDAIILTVKRWKL